MDIMLILGIETSCDETAAAVVKNGREALSNIVSSSLRLHRPFAGVVPEIACRHHAELIDTVVSRALYNAGCNLKDIGCIAVTNRPGLIGALLVGVTFAKGLSLANKMPLLGVNHLYAHLYAPWMDEATIEFPFIGLVVSGGHTSLLLVKDFDRYKLLGQTTDDAVGEAFDKVAKILGLGYPGGPMIEKSAKKGKPEAIKFPVSRLGDSSLDFSFSGIKTAVLYYVQHKSKKKNYELRNDISDICASFQESVVSVLAEKSIKACSKMKIPRLVVGGGVSINSRLKEKLKDTCQDYGVSVFFPPKRLCLDNAVMVAGLGYRLFKKGHRSGLDLNAYAE